MSILRTEFRRTETKNSTHKASAPIRLRLGMHWHRILCFFWFMVLLLQTSETHPRLEGAALLAVGLFATLAVYFAACFARPVKPRDAASWLQLPKRALLFARRTIR
jgi:hypothetical protein